ncbi:unnamed protein product [Moneuplotes crassus]|uniref:Uncharacterized protein n=1 Tax=Euplotes crassus TaxID=5936 RepID=A0AAD2CZU8_EUPCR|nr:unnamed protein product [Moneuplotes crassus]
MYNHVPKTIEGLSFCREPAFSIETYITEPSMRSLLEGRDGCEPRERTPSFPRNCEEQVANQREEEIVPKIVEGVLQALDKREKENPPLGPIIDMFSGGIVKIVTKDIETLETKVEKNVKEYMKDFCKTVTNKLKCVCQNLKERLEKPKDKPNPNIKRGDSKIDNFFPTTVQNDKTSLTPINNLTEDLIKKTTEQIPEKITEEITEAITEAIPKEIIKDIPKKVTKEEIKDQPKSASQTSRIEDDAGKATKGVTPTKSMVYTSAEENFKNTAATPKPRGRKRKKRSPKSKKQPKAKRKRAK